MTTLPTGTVTFLFTDIEGSTKLVQALGEAFHDVLGRHHEIMRAAIAENGGTVVSTEGDAFFAVFDSAPSAVSAAFLAQRTLEAFPWPEGAAIRVRMGLHTGEGKLGGDNYSGLDVNRAARIGAAGHGGQILVSAVTRALVEDLAEVTATDLGEHRLKDIERPEHLYQLNAPGLPSEFPPPRTLDSRPNNLLQQLTPFIGRDREVKELSDMLSSARLVTLTGPGGTGKTRLALEVAARRMLEFADGAFFVPLAPVVDPALVPSTIAQTFELMEKGDRPISDLLCEYLGSLERLVVLDNFEQVLDAAPFVAEILASAPKVKVIVTSRAALRISGEQEYPVPPMAAPDPDELPALDVLADYDAVGLFVQRAAAVKPDFELTDEDAPAVAAICARLEGLPLAIELAAARIRLLGPAEIVERLDSSLTFLKGGSRDLPARQQTLRAAIAWSYDLLDDAEKALFRRLAVFAGGFEFGAVEAVCNPGDELGIDTLDCLESLAEKSLIRRFESDLGASRGRMLVVIREYALDALRESGEYDEIRGRHARYFSALAERAEPEMTGAENWPDRLELDNDNLRAVLQYCIDGGDLEIGLFLAGRIWRFWHLRGHIAEGREWLERLLAHPNAQAATAARAKAQMGLGSITYWMGDYDVTRAHYEGGLKIYEELGDEAGIGDALFNLGYAAAVVKDWATAAERQRAARAIRERLGDRAGMAWAAAAGGLAASFSGDQETAEDFGNQARGTFRELDDWYGEMFAEYVLFLVARARKDFLRAIESSRDFFEISRDNGDLSGIAGGLDLYADVLVSLGYYDKALRLHGAAAHIKEVLGAAAPEALIDVCDPRVEARGHLSDEVIEATWAEGFALEAEEALALALKEQETAPSDMSGH